MYGFGNSASTAEWSAAYVEAVGHRSLTGAGAQVYIPDVARLLGQRRKDCGETSFYTWAVDSW